MKRLVLLLLAPIAAFAAAPTFDWSPNLTLSAAWLNNVTNGEAVWDRIGAMQFGGDVVASSRYAVSPHDTFHLTAHFAADWVPRFYALTRGAAGARLDWQHTFGDDAFAPVFTIEGGGDAVAATEAARRGTDGAVTLRLQKRFEHGWRAALIQRFDRYAAHSPVFDNRSSTTAIEIGRDLNNATRLTLTGSWRDGDVVTYAQYHRPDLLAIAHAYAPLPTFHQNMTAYSATGKTIAGKLALVHATSESAAIELAYEYARTSGTDLRFANQVISLSIIHQY